MTKKKIVDCNKCKNFASYYCRDCIHRLGVSDFYREADYETTSSQEKRGVEND